MSTNGPGSYGTGSYGGGSGGYFNSKPNQFRLNGVGQNPDPTQAQNGMQGQAAGLMGGLRDFGMGALPGMLFGSKAGPMATLGQYGLKQAFGGAGLKALGMGIPGIGQAQMVGALLPAALGGLSSLGRSLGIGRKSGPSPEELAMGEAKGNMMNMRGSYGADMGMGRSMLDKYNPMLEDQIGRLQDLSNRGLSTEFNTRQMAGAASQTEAARRAAEARMKATSGMIGGGQALSGFGGINQAAVGGMAQGSYNAAMNNMNQQPGYINQLSGMIGNQINRGQGLFDQGRQNMFQLDQNMYSLNAQEKARADALSQSNRDREAAALGGIGQLGMSYLGDQANEAQMDRLMKMYGMGDEAQAMPYNGMNVRDLVAQRAGGTPGGMAPQTQMPGMVGVGDRQFGYSDGSGMGDVSAPPRLGNRGPILGNAQLASGPSGAYQSPFDQDPTYGFGNMGPRGVRSSLYPDPTFGIGRFDPRFRL